MNLRKWLLVVAPVAALAVGAGMFMMLRVRSAPVAPSRATSDSTTPRPTETSPAGTLATPSPGSSPATIQGEVGPSGGEGAATDLRATPGCGGENVPLVALSWSAAVRRGDEQVIVMTKYPNGFETGRFSTSPSLGEEVSSYTWRGVEPGVGYQWRVLTKHAGSYTPSETHSFRGEDCLADG